MGWVFKGISFSVEVHYRFVNYLDRLKDTDLQDLSRRGAVLAGYYGGVSFFYSKEP